MRNLEVPTKYQRMFEKAATGRSRNAAIRAHCLMCMGSQEGEIEMCTSPECPLFHYRLPLPTSNGGQACAIEPELVEV